MQHNTQVWPMVQASQYADDILLMSHDASSLRDANGYLEGWMRKHGVQFNVGKCHYFCTDAKAACEDFCIGGKRLECANLLENLGGRFRLNPEGLPVADEQHKNRVYDRFKDVAERLGRLSVGWDVRAADVRAIMPLLTYPALAWDPAEFSDARRQRLLVKVLSGGKENTRRCVEVSLAVLSAVHRTCIPAALLHEQVLILGRLINVSADFRREVQEHFRLCRDMEVAPPGSFFATFQASLHEYGWHWLEWNTLTSHEGVEFSLDGDTLAMAQGHRSMCDWRRDMKGLVEVDRDRLRTLWQKVSDPQMLVSLFLLLGIDVWSLPVSGPPVHWEMYQDEDGDEDDDEDDDDDFETPLAPNRERSTVWHIRNILFTLSRLYGEQRLSEAEMFALKLLVLSVSTEAVMSGSATRQVRPTARPVLLPRDGDAECTYFRIFKHIYLHCNKIPAKDCVEMCQGSERHACDNPYDRKTDDEMFATMHRGKFRFWKIPYDKFLQLIEPSSCAVEDPEDMDAIMVHTHLIVITDHGLYFAQRALVKKEKVDTAFRSFKGGTVTRTINLDVIPQVGHAPDDMEHELAWLMDQNDEMDVEVLKQTQFSDIVKYTQIRDPTGANKNHIKFAVRRPRVAGFMEAKKDSKKKTPLSAEEQKDQKQPVIGSKIIADSSSCHSSAREEYAQLQGRPHMLKITLILLALYIVAPGDIEVYKAKLRSEFGYSNKDMKADPDLKDMEARLAAFEKRS
ncbi:hypothetical protein AK812_SmicGene30407 [Symbiodinium microadriaticum]|uniref:Reverse transcriptase domain-containing protein n=1 Tax=Symbiodinium microadriaticum TaxID=2951 RepID=A0A1Q9CZD2_SYMMI|nr:hypothetical protein AK812_SmicGene30407 [Symbiodinium microadriaticum]